MADELRHAPMREDFIEGDMVSLMQGKWEELWKIKMGLLGRKDLRYEFNVRLGSFTETLTYCGYKNFMCMTLYHNKHTQKCMVVSNYKVH